MSKITHLPLIALVTLGLAACGDGDQSAAEQRSDQLEDQADALDERADAIDDSDDTMLVDDEPDPMADDPMAGSMGDPMMEGEGMVTVTVDGVQQDGGTVYVGLQDTADFASLNVTQGGTAEPTSDSVEVMIEGVPAGRYAVVAFQDTNGDGSTNLGPTGPEEPWGISGYEGGSTPDPMNAMMDVQGDTTANVSLQGGM